MPGQWCFVPDGGLAVEGGVAVVGVELAGVVEVLPVAALASAAPPPAIAPVAISVAATRMGLMCIGRPSLWLEPNRCAHALETRMKRRRIGRDRVRVLGD